MTSISLNGDNLDILYDMLVGDTTAGSAPTVTDSRISISGASGTAGAFKIGDTVTATWNNTAGGDNNSSTITGVTVNFSQFGGGTAVAASNSSGTWTATYTIVTGSIDGTNKNVSVTATSSGGSTTTADTTNATVDNIVPTVTDAKISISGASGTAGAFKIGDTVTATWNNTAGGDNNSDTISAVTVNFSQFGGGTAVTATYSSGTWTATYTIVAGAIDSVSRYISVTATDNAGNTRTTADTTYVTVDTIAPTVTDAKISISGASGTSGAFKIGDTVTATWNNTAGGDNNSDTMSAVTVNFSQFGGGSGVTATNSSGTWTATYTIVSGAISASNRNVVVTATDNAGNSTTTSDTSNATVDNTSPTVTSVSVPANGTYSAGQNLDFTVTMTEAVTVDTTGGTPRISLVIGSTTYYASYISGSGTTSLLFRHTLQAGAGDSDGITVGSMALNGGTMRDARGNDLNTTLNAVGATSGVLVGGPPDAPLMNFATAGDAQATVAFVAPSDNGGSAITSYTVTSNPGGITGTGASSPVTVTGLTNGTAYSFTVTATNAYGTGIPSVPSNPVTPAGSQTITFTNPGVQNFGTAPTLSATSSSGLTVSFTSSTTGVCTITSGGALTFVSAGTCSINADQAGNGSFTAATQVAQTFSVAAVVPGAPTIGTATAGNTQATVAFTAPASNGGGAITSYTVTSSPGGLTGTGASSPVTVAGLTNGTAYTFTVTATNAAGPGAASAASNAVTPATGQTITFTNPGAQNFGTTPTLSATSSSGLTVSFTSSTTGVCTITSGGALTFVSAGTCSINADQAGNGSFTAAPQVTQTFTVATVTPGAPTIGAATAGNTQASVAFTAPVNNGGGAITSYTVTSSPGGFTGTSASSPVTVTGLTNGTAYTFTVTATNAAGPGAASAASNAVTPATGQTITFTNPGAQNFGTTPTLSATSSSGLTVSFTSSTTGVCTITSGGALTFVSAGTCSINADQAGNGSFTAAPQVTQTFTVATVTPGAPTIGTATAGNTQASVAFTAPVNNGGSAITSYTVTSSPGGFTGTGGSSPVTVTGLTNGTAYTFTVRATNAAGPGAASAASNAVTPNAANTAPVANSGVDQTVGSAVAVALDGTGSSDPDSDPLTYSWSQTSGAAVVLTGATSAQPTFTAPTLAVGAADATLIFSLTVNDGITNSAADTVTITVQAAQPSPAGAFAAAEQVIADTAAEDASRSLQSGLVFSQRMTREARGRLVAAQQPEQAATNVPFDVEGNVDGNGVTLSSKGTFFGQTGSADGAQRRLVFGDFDVQHDGDTGTSTATINGRMAWEHKIAGKTLLGYFIGGELAHSTFAGDFTGDQERVGLNIGTYGVQDLGHQVYLDGFISIGAGQNNLAMESTVLALESDYITRTVSFGAALSGVIEQEGYEIWPELSFSYGETWIDTMKFTGLAYGLVDNTLTLEAGKVTLANILFRPEFRLPMDGLGSAESLQLLTFAPRLICEEIQTATTEQNCGGGAEIGFSGQSSDGLSRVSAKLMADRLGDTLNSSVQLSLEQQF